MCDVSDLGVSVGGVQGRRRSRWFLIVRRWSVAVGRKADVGVETGADTGSDMSVECIVADRGRVDGLAMLGSLVDSKNMALVEVDLAEKVDVGFEKMLVMAWVQSARLVLAHCCCRSVDMVVGDMMSEAAHWDFAEVADMRMTAVMMPVGDLVEVEDWRVVVHTAASRLECNNLQRPW